MIKLNIGDGAPEEQPAVQPASAVPGDTTPPESPPNPAPVSEATPADGQSGVTPEPRTAEGAAGAGATAPPPSDLETEPAPDPASPAPKSTAITVTSACMHVLGNNTRKNDQDFCLTDQYDFEKQGVRVVKFSLNDGIGGEAPGGENYAAGATHMFMGMMQMHIPGWGTQSQRPRGQFLAMLNEQVTMWFPKTVHWVHKNVNGIGLTKVEAGKLFGATWICGVLVCDLLQGEVNMYAYSVGDSDFYLVTPTGAEKLNKKHEVMNRFGKLVMSKWLGQEPVANGDFITRRFKLDRLTLPSIQLLAYSDGVANMCSPEDNAAHARALPPTQAVDAILNSAMTVEVPYGRQLHKTDDPEELIQPGDDNASAVDISIQIQEN